jgi:hypothetical protein
MGCWIATLTERSLAMTKTHVPSLRGGRKADAAIQPMKDVDFLHSPSGTGGR